MVGRRRPSVRSTSSTTIRGPVDVLLRPEELRLADAAGGVAPDSVVGEGVVDLVEFYGHDTIYVVGLADGTQLRVRAGSAPAHGRGDPVTVSYAGRPALAYATP